MQLHLRRLTRLGLFGLHIVLGLFMGLAARFSPRPERWSQRWFRGLLRVFRVRLEVVGQPTGQGALFAGNHISWLDIAVLVSAHPVIFVSKAEVAGWPLIGWLARAGGTLFIERGAHGTQALNEELTALLRAGRCVVIFPEATTTRGESVRTFHSRLFAGAINSDRPVQPFALRYREACVPYVDDQSLIDNLWALLGEPAIHAELHLGAPLPAADTRKAAARATQAWVESALAQRASWHSGLPETKERAGRN